jgi:hypothetical protein
MPMTAAMATGSRSKLRAPKVKAKAKPAPARRAKKSAARRSAPSLDVDADVLEFIAALDAYKAAHSRPFPSWSEVLHVLRSLGYRRR